MVNIHALDMNINMLANLLGIRIYFVDNIAGRSTYSVSENISHKEGIYKYIDTKF